MLNQYMDIILYITGGVTTSIIIQLFAPVLYIRFFNKIEIQDSNAIFFARLWALLVGTLGLLIIWAGCDESIRVPVLVAASISKTMFILVLFLNFSHQGKGFVPAIIFDGISVILYVSYLSGL